MNTPHHLGTRAFSLLETLVVIAIIGVAIGVGHTSLSGAKTRALIERDSATQRLLNDAETRSVVAGMGNGVGGKHEVLGRYLSGGIIRTQGNIDISRLEFAGGVWVAGQVGAPGGGEAAGVGAGGAAESGSSTGADAGPAMGGAGTFDYDAEVLWNQYAQAVAAGAGRDWLENSVGGKLEAMFVYLDDANSQTDFAHLAAGAPAARMFEAAWSLAVEKLIAESFTDASLARDTYDHLTEPRKSRFAGWLRPGAHW